MIKALRVFFQDLFPEIYLFGDKLVLGAKNDLMGIIRGF